MSMSLRRLALITADSKQVRREMTENHGVGAFLLAGSEIAKMRS